MCYIGNMNSPLSDIITNIISSTQAETTDLSTRAKATFKLICVSKCKRHAVEMAKQLRPANKFTRVSEEFLMACEANLKLFINSRIKSHPSKGKTLT